MKINILPTLEIEPYKIFFLRKGCETNYLTMYVRLALNSKLSSCFSLIDCWGYRHELHVWLKHSSMTTKHKLGPIHG